MTALTGNASYTYKSETRTIREVLRAGYTTTWPLWHRKKHKRWWLCKYCHTHKISKGEYDVHTLTSSARVHLLANMRWVRNREAILRDGVLVAISSLTNAGHELIGFRPSYLADRSGISLSYEIRSDKVELQAMMRLRYDCYFESLLRIGQFPLATLCCQPNGQCQLA